MWYLRVHLKASTPRGGLSLAPGCGFFFQDRSGLVLSGTRLTIVNPTSVGCDGRSVWLGRLGGPLRLARSSELPRAALPNLVVAQCLCQRLTADQSRTSLRLCPSRPVGGGGHSAARGYVVGEIQVASEGGKPRGPGWHPSQDVARLGPCPPPTNTVCETWASVSLRPSHKTAAATKQRFRMTKPLKA